MADLFLMVGCSGSGKSTFLKNNVNKENSVIISRDEIRFSIVKPYENLFSHEKEVLNELWDRANNALVKNKNVFVDQTSLTPKSRKYLIEHVHGYEHVNAIWIDEDLDTCLERNKTREGTRAYVPETVIHRMHFQLVRPTLNEGFYRIFRYNSKENKITYEGVKI